MPSLVIAPAWASARNVLCVRLDGMGDVIMTGPAIRAVKESLGVSTRVTLLTSPSAAPAARLLPGVDKVYESRVPWMKHDDPDSAATLRSLVEALAAERFDAGIVFTAYSQSALPAAVLLGLAGIPLSLAHTRDKPYHLLTHPVPETEPERGVRHEVRRQLDLVASVGPVPHDEWLRVTVQPDALRSVQRLLCERGVVAPFVALHPGASAPSRRYRADLYREVVEELAELGLPVVVTHSAAESALADVVAGGRGIISPPLAVVELAALLQLAAVVVTNNTGPAHLAAAVGSPVVDLYAQTNPQHTPWMVPSQVLTRDVPCRNCAHSLCATPGHPCLDEIPPREVVEATVDLLSKSPPALC